MYCWALASKVLCIIYNFRDLQSRLFLEKLACAVSDFDLVWDGVGM